MTAMGLRASVFLSLSLLFFPVPAAGREAPVRIGVLAKRGVERCMERWGPTAEYLSAQVRGYSFEITPLGFDEIDPAVEKGAVDFVLCNSSFYVGLEILYGVDRIATLKNRVLGGTYTVFSGVIFHRVDRRDIENLSDLVGKRFMAVEPTSLGGWRMAWREMMDRGIDPYRDFSDLRFGGTQDAVVYAVRDGEVDAGTIRSDTLERMAAEGKIDIKTFRVIHIPHEGREYPFLHSTRFYPEWPFSRAKHTPEALAEKVAGALLNMPEDGPAARAARCAGWTIPHHYQAVHDCLKELRVGPYRDFGKVTFEDVIKQHWNWFLATFTLLAIMALTIGRMIGLNRSLNLSRSNLEREMVQREEAEKALREAERNRVLMETAGAAAHEINQPLTVLIGMSQILLGRMSPDDPQRGDIEAIVQAGERISGIVKKMEAARQYATRPYVGETDIVDFDSTA